MEILIYLILFILALNIFILGCYGIVRFIACLEKKHSLTTFSIVILIINFAAIYIFIWIYLIVSLAKNFEGFL